MTNSSPLVRSTVSQELTVRSAVATGLAYGEYREHLRSDFFYSCAYCTLSECEAKGIRFTIDHYEPQSERPDLENDYHNLFYCCNECNILKGDFIPSVSARANGLRYFRSDSDVRSEHFIISGVRLKDLTKVGYFTVEALDLNRQSLRRLRDIRRRLDDCDEMVAQGIMALRSFHIDQLPQRIRGSANKAISDLARFADNLQEAIDSVLKAAARSPLIDVDEDKSERRAERSEKLSEMQGLFPGKWRGRKARKRSTAKA